MYRDFSESSKANLIGLVSEVENEKLSSFTDWIGDRWYDFESWIGKLNIRNYINNVNAYHKKVIDKNNTTKQQIENIFSNVATVDNSYKNLFSCLNTQLQQWQRYIGELSQVVAPTNGRFDANYISYNLETVLKEIRRESVENFRRYLTEILDKDTQDVVSFFRLTTGSSSFSSNFTSNLVLQLLMQNMSSGQMDSTLTGENIKTRLNLLSGINKNIGKYGDNEELTLSSSVLGYLSKLCGVATSNSKSGLDITSNFLSLFESSVEVEKGIFDYYEKTLHPYEAMKLDGRFGKTILGLNFVSSFLGATNEGIGTYQVFVDPNSSAFDKAAQSLKMGDSVFDFGGNTYIAYQASNKSLQFISSASGSSKAVNQILATDQTLKYTTSSVATKNISKVGTALAIGSVVTSTASSGIKRYGEVSADGKLDVVDVASVGVYGSLSGLNTVTSSLTFGVVSFDSEKVASDLENESSEFVKGDSWAAQYIRNQDNNAVLRFGVSVGSGAYLVGKKVVNGVADGAKTVGSWVSTGWNTVTNLF